MVENESDFNLISCYKDGAAIIFMVYTSTVPLNFTVPVSTVEDFFTIDLFKSVWKSNLKRMPKEGKKNSSSVLARALGGGIYF